MVDIQSKEVIDKISDDLKVQPSMQIPRELAKLIQLVYNVNPERDVIIVEGNINDSAAVTFHTAHITKKTFITGALISVAKDVVNDSLSSNIGVTIPTGVSRSLIKIRYEPLTAGEHTQSICFNPPIELKKGTSISLTNTQGTASIDTTGIIYFYEVDPL